MKMILTHFMKEEDGAVTVDWVVLTAAMVGLGAIVISTVANGALNHSTSIGQRLSVMTVASN